MTVRVVFAVFACMLLIDACVAVDASKFIRCDQSGFCRRNRALAADGNSDFVIDPSTISLNDNGDELVADVSNGAAQLQLKLSGFNAQVLRVQVDEKEPLHPRYRVQDVVIDENKESVTLSKEAGEGNTYTRVTWGDNHVRLNHAPFSVEVFRGKELVLTVGKRGLFNFEHYRTKESEGDAHPDGGWEETFGSHTDSKPRGPSSVGADINFPGAAEVYGIPEHADTLALGATKGEGISSEPYRLFNLDVFEYDLDSKMALYGAIPFMLGHSESGTVGVLWLNAAETWIDVEKNTGGVPGSVDTHWFSESGIVDLFVFVGPSPKETLQQYAQVTGLPALPQYFAIAYHQCRWNYKDEEDVRQVNAGFDQHDIPYDVLWLDIEHTNGKRYFTWDPSAFPTPADMQNKLADNGRKMVTIVDPHIKVDTSYPVHNEIKSRGLYVKKPDGGDYEGWCWPGSSGYPDFTNPQMRQYWASKFALDQYQGSTKTLYTWNDMNEPSVFNGPEVSMQRDMIHMNNHEHRDVHNMYGIYVHMATYQGHLARSDNADRPFVLSRAFFAGSQRYGAIWTGDNKAEWGHLKASNPMLLSLNVAGLSFVGADVGGFFRDPEVELLLRWYQAGVFQPFFRAHGHLDTKRREPWLYGEENKNIIRDAVRTRYALLPFWYTVFEEASRTGLPVMRPLFFEYPTESVTFTIEDQFLIGSDLLVKPVTASGVTSMQVVLPGAQPWYDYKTHTRYEGGQTVTMACAMNQGIPVLQRGGSIIPRRERIRRASSLSHNDPLTLVVALDNNGKAEGELYMDDGHSFEHEANNAYLRRKFAFGNGALTSVTADANGVFKTPVVVERLVIIGMKQPPKAVRVGSTQLDFVFKSASQTLTVRKPDVPVTEDWTVTFE